MPMFNVLFVSLTAMLRRPKPTDSEADLLREQEHFLTSGAPSAALTRGEEKLEREKGRVGRMKGARGMWSPLKVTDDTDFSQEHIVF